MRSDSKCWPSANNRGIFEANSSNKQTHQVAFLFRANSFNRWRETGHLLSSVSAVAVALVSYQVSRIIIHLHAAAASSALSNYLCRESNGAGSFSPILRELLSLEVAIIQHLSP